MRRALKFPSRTARSMPEKQQNRSPCMSSPHRKRLIQQQHQEGAMHKLLTAADRQLKRLFITVSDKKDQPPGTMVYTGKQTSEPLRISVIDYDAEALSERDN